MDIEKVLDISKGLPDEDRLAMILSNRIDVGHTELGGCVSVRQFRHVAKDLLFWRDHPER